MTADDLIELLQERPFKPLGLHLADGDVRDISQPHMALVAKNTVLIGTPSARDPRIAARTVSCSVSSIVKVERVECDDDARYLAETLGWL